MQSAQKREASGIFRGWWVVLATAVGLALHSGPIIAATFGVFLEPLSHEFGWTRAELSMAFSLFTLTGAAAALVVGRWVDRIGARRVILCSVALFSLAVASFYLLSARLWHLYALYIGLGIVGSGTTPLAYSKVIAEWFDQKRGLALAMGIVGSSVGSLLLPPFAHALVDQVGWRMAYAYLGLLIAGIALPVVALLLAEAPGRNRERDAQERGAPHLPGPELSGGEVLRRASFWRMAGAFFFLSIAFSGCFVHLVPLLTDRGVSRQSAALAMSVCAGGSLVGRLLCGYLLDRFAANRVAVGFFCAAALGMALLCGSEAGATAFVAAWLIGLMVGAELDLIAYMCSRLFGLRAFGEIYSYVYALFVLGGAIGPALMGFGYDATGSYEVVLRAFLMAPALGIALLGHSGSPPHPTRPLGATKARRGGSTA